MPQRVLDKKAPKSNVGAERKVAGRRKEIGLGRRLAARNAIGSLRGSPKK